MKGFGIYVKNDLLDPKHIQAIGSSLWEYLWCLDKITSIDESGVGKVLGGKPIKMIELSNELGISERHISLHLKKLQDTGYINMVRTGYGYLITVNKSAKIFGNNKNLQKVTSDNKNDSQNTKKVISTAKKVISNKTIQLDNTNSTKVLGDERLDKRKPEINEMFSYWQETVGYAVTGNVQKNRYACKNLLKKYSLPELQQLVRGVAMAQNEEYAPQISDFCELQSKLNNLLRWGRQQSQSKIKEF